MVHPRRLKDLEVEKIKDIESIIQQRDFLKDFSHYIKRTQGKEPQDIE